MRTLIDLRVKGQGQSWSLILLLRRGKTVPVLTAIFLKVLYLLFVSFVLELVSCPCFERPNPHSTCFERPNPHSTCFLQELPIQIKHV